MNCQRCQGLMLHATFSDFFRMFHAWRCCNCGAIMDRTISDNRRDSQIDAAHHKTLARRWLRRPPLSMSQS
jgi:hypothetical protein